MNKVSNRAGGMHTGERGSFQPDPSSFFLGTHSQRDVGPQTSKRATSEWQVTNRTAFLIRRLMNDQVLSDLKKCKS